jgi:hypothetical protein
MVPSAETTGAFNTGSDTVNLHRLTEAAALALVVALGLALVSAVLVLVPAAPRCSPPPGPSIITRRAVRSHRLSPRRSVLLSVTAASRAAAILCYAAAPRANSGVWVLLIPVAGPGGAGTFRWGEPRPPAGTQGRRTPRADLFQLNCRPSQPWWLWRTRRRWWLRSCP